MRQGGSEGLDPMIDPPATAFTLEPAPGRALGRNYRRSCRERFPDRQAKVLVQSRENEKVGLPVGGGLRIAGERALHGNAGEAQSPGERAEFIVMPCFRRSNDPQTPAWIPRLDFRPGMQQPTEAFFWVNAPEREHNTFEGRIGLPRGQLGKIDPEGNDRDGIGEAEAADLF